MGIELSKVDAIIERHGKEGRALIPLLLDVQKEFFYLPEEAMERVADKTGLPAIQVYQVARFYKAFSLKPRGKHTCLVCLGTACHVRGGPKILEELERKLDVPAGETTKDGQFTLETVACLGACGIAPVMVVNDRVHAQVTPEAAEIIVDALMQRAAEPCLDLVEAEK
jgi:NADH:ubiquinone oxidoreductase subunit E